MTPEQESRCAALAKRIAALRPDWAVPGVACSDHQTGDLFRLVTRHADGPYWTRSLHGHNGSTCVGIFRPDEVASCGCNRAIANGPDWRDEATIGALLMHYLPRRDLLFFATTWAVMAGAITVGEGDTRAEAILAAVVAALGGKDGSV